LKLLQQFKAFLDAGDSGSGVLTSHEVEKFFGILTHPGFDVVAAHIMPLDAIAVEVVQDGNTSLVGSILAELAVVGLGRPGAASGGPVTPPAHGGVSGRDAAGGARPEPSVHDWWLEISSVTAVEVALPPRSPNVLDICLGHLVVDELRLLGRLQAHQVLAMLPADVPCIEPVPLMRPGGFVLPRKEVVAVVADLGGVSNPVHTGFQVGSDELPTLLGFREGQQSEESEHDR